MRILAIVVLVMGGALMLVLFVNTLIEVAEDQGIRRATRRAAADVLRRHTDGQPDPDDRSSP